METADRKVPVDVTVELFDGGSRRNSPPSNFTNASQPIRRTLLECLHRLSFIAQSVNLAKNKRKTAFTSMPVESIQVNAVEGVSSGRREEANVCGNDEGKRLVDADACPEGVGTPQRKLGFAVEAAGAQAIVELEIHATR